MFSYVEIMPPTTNKDEYLKHYLDDSLSISNKINTIIKKGEQFQKVALLKNINAYVNEQSFGTIITYIIGDIGTWDSESILLLPKTLYTLITNNILSNDLFNTLFKHIIVNTAIGADSVKDQYIFYFDKIIEFFSPTKKGYKPNKNKKIGEKFTYSINNDIFEFVYSLGIFGKSSNDRRLSCYLSSCLCRLIIQDDENDQDDKVQKLYLRLTYLFSDGDTLLAWQLARELHYIIPFFKNTMFMEQEIIKAINYYIKHESDSFLQSKGIISLLNNITHIVSQKKIVELLLDEIKIIIENKDYEIKYKNDIMDTLINSLYYNHSDIKSIIQTVKDFEIIEYYIQNCINTEGSMKILIKNFDKIYFLLKKNEENESINENQNHIELTPNFNIFNTQNQITSSCNEIYDQNKLSFSDLFLKIYNRLYQNSETNETNNSNNNLIKLENVDSKEIENLINVNKELFFQKLIKMVSCFEESFKEKKELRDILFDLFKKEKIEEILKFYQKKTKNMKKNGFYKLLKFLLKNNYNIYLFIYKSRNFSNIHEFTYDDNYYNSLFLNILNNIFSLFEKVPNNSYNEIYLFIAKIINLLIPKLHKYLKNIVIIIINNNYDLNNESKENNCKNKIFYLEQLYEEIFKNILSVMISEKNLGDHIKKEYIKIMPNLILYSRNRISYLEYLRKEIIKSNNFFFRKYSNTFFKQCFENFSYNFLKKMKINEDIYALMKDKNNILSICTIELIYKYNKKIIAYSFEEFKIICEILNEVYKLNSEIYNKDIKKFDKEKNRLINQILNIKGINNHLKYSEEDLFVLKDNENNLYCIENDIFNWEKNNKINKIQNKDGRKCSSDLHVDNIFKSSVPLIGLRNLSNDKYINLIGCRKSRKLSDKISSNIIKSLTNKNLVNGRTNLPKIKGHNPGKDSILKLQSNKNNLFLFKSSEPINTKLNNFDMEKSIILKDKSQYFQKGHKRLPSSKIYKGIASNIIGNIPNEESCNKKTNNKSVSNKNINSVRKHITRAKTLCLQKEINSNYLNSNKLFIYADKNQNSIK